MDTLLDWASTHQSLAALCLLSVPVAVIWIRARPEFWINVPVVGFSDPLLSYITAYQIIFNGKKILRDAYSKYHNGMFLLPGFQAWTVYVCGPRLIEEISQLSTDTASLLEASKETTQADFTLGPGIMANPWHLAPVKNQMTKNLPISFPDIADEIKYAFKTNVDEICDASSDGIASIGLVDHVYKVICCAVNRIFIGLPLCRNPDVLSVSKNYARDVAFAALVLTKVPVAFRGIVASLLPTASKKHFKSMGALLVPLINDRLEVLAKSGGDWNSLPEDYITWMMEINPGKIVPEDIVARLLSIHMAAIDTSSILGAMTIFHLAARPQFVEPLREEVREMVGAFGWSKEAMDRCVKLNSFMRESTRFNPITLNGMNRVAMKTFTLSNGTVIPKGVWISTPSEAQNFDKEIFGDDADEFNPWRYLDETRKDQSYALRHSITTTSSLFLLFGHGRHGCPGRFFAVYEIKALMAHILLNYDMEFADEKLRNGRFPVKWLGFFNLLDESVKMNFRVRKPDGVQ